VLYLSNTFIYFHWETEKCHLGSQQGDGPCGEVQHLSDTQSPAQ